MSDLREEKEYLLKTAFNLLEERYPSGLYEWLYIHDRATNDEINRLEDRVNANFLNGGSINDLKAILREYWIVHMKAIRAYEAAGKVLDLDSIRQQRMDELEIAHTPQAE